MIRRSLERTLVLQPGNAARWDKQRGDRSRPRSKSCAFTARRTIDVTRDLRAWIKIAAFERSVTVAYMLCLLLLKGGRR